MLCEECGQRPATIHVTKVENGVKTERHLCADCAREIGGIEFSINPFQVSEMLSGFLTHGKTEPAGRNTERCPACGMTYGEFARTGKFGCGSCYGAFGMKLNPLLRRVHGSVEHRGKVPKRRATQVTKAQELDALKAQLEEAVKREAYEEAAVLRDRIKEIDQGTEPR